ncbi:hypothetical protein M422DRAFT_163982, partial [Sphaerobolus stellatus SS14]
AISADEIKDRSKSDSVAKTIATAQILWFITQIIARGVQKQAITQLELTTVAIAVPNILMYLCWWHKPMDIQFPTILRLRQPTNNLAVETEDEFQGLLAPFKDVGPFSTAFKITLMWSIGAPISELLGGEEECSKDRLYFYAEDSHNDNKLDTVVFVVATSSFSATNQIVWSFTFPSHAEQILWRVAGCIITATPLSAVVIQLSPDYLERPIFTQMKLLPIGRIILGWFFLLLPLYVLARMFLLIEGIIARRNLPPSSIP